MLSCIGIPLLILIIFFTSLIIFYKYQEGKYLKERNIQEKYISYLINEHYNKILIISEIQKNNFSLEYFKAKYKNFF